MFSRVLYLLSAIILRLPFFKFIRETSDYQCPNTLSLWIKQKILGLGNNKRVYWPVHPTSQIQSWNKIIIGVDTSPGLMRGCYIQGTGGITIGDYTQIGPNVVIISANHDLYDTRKHLKKEVRIGKYCWIGAGAKIMPGVTLGDFTIVGAGAVVTKSFTNGYCVIGGNSARLIKTLEKKKCIKYEYSQKYYGYLSEGQFNTLINKRIISLP